MGTKFWQRAKKSKDEPQLEKEIEKPSSRRAALRRFFKSFGEKKQESGNALMKQQSTPQPPIKESEPIPTIQVDTISGDQAVPEAQEQDIKPVDSVAEPTPASSPEEIKPEPKKSLSEEEIRALFSGAPQFSIDVVNGRPQPQISFPWDFSLRVHDQSDSVPLSHSAYSSATLRKHITSPRQDVVSPVSGTHYDEGVVEVPSMLSAQGADPGTCGFDHFLELPVSDTLYTGEAEDKAGDAVFDAIKNRDLFWDNSEKLGIRQPDLKSVTTRLSELCALYVRLNSASGDATKTILDDYKPAELYTALFGRLLTPPRFDSSANDPTGMKVQIQAIIQILGIKGIWKDFALVEWRIRLGQLLWPTSTSTDADDGSPVVLDEDTKNQRLALLLQVALAAELVLRLDAIVAMDMAKLTGEVHLDASDVFEFRKLMTRKISWDLILARRFLENVVVQYVPPPAPEPNKPERSSGLWAFLSPTQTSAPEQKQQGEEDVLVLPRYQKRQIEGLVHFARAIGWPNVDAFEAQTAETLNAPIDLEQPASPSSMATSIYGTPLATPRSGVSSLRGSYFPSSPSRPGVTRSASALSVKLHSPTSSPSASQTVGAANVIVGGWLTRTYLTSLILPGEALSHFLISSLLENDLSAIGELNNNANLYGGFIYAGRSWWSKACIVGRVLAALPGTKESMGWIGLHVQPQGVSEGTWVDIWSEETLPKHDERPRIEEQTLVSQDSDFLGNTPLEKAYADDLTMPLDPPASRVPDEDVEIRFLKLNLHTRPTSSGGLSAHSSSSDLPTDQLATHTASLTFLLSPNRHLEGTQHEQTEVTFELRHDVHFVSSFPCTPPSSSLHLLNHPSVSVTSDEDGQAMGGDVPAHPLYKRHSFSIVAAAELILQPPSLDYSSTLVVDARSASSAEVLARAWCAERGYHALINLASRTCIACSVREARAAGIRVVIRTSERSEAPVSMEHKGSEPLPPVANVEAARTVYGIEERGEKDHGDGDEEDSVHAHDSGSDDEGEEDIVWKTEGPEGWKSWGRMRGSYADF